MLDEGKHQDDVLGWGFSAQKRERKGDVNQVFNTYMCSRLKDQDVRTLLLA